MSSHTAGTAGSGTAQVPAESRPRVTFVYRGSHRDAKKSKTIYHHFVEVAEDWKNVKVDVEDTRLHRSYMLKGFHARPGAVYSFETSGLDDGKRTIFTNTQRWLGVWPDEAQVAIWQGEEDARKADQDRDRAEERFRKERRYLAGLEPLRRLYRQLGPADKALLMVRVTQALTGSKSLQGEED